MRFDDVKKLHQKRYREELGYFLVEGEHPVLELQKAARDNPGLHGCELYVTGEHESWKSQFETHVINSVQMAQISDTRTPQGIVALVPRFAASPALPGERVIYLHEISDPGNLGTILRTLAWFGKLRCLLSPGSVDPYNSKVVRASMGAIFHVPIETDVEMVALSQRFQRIACLDTRGDAITSAAFGSFDCYLFGSEAHGLPHESMSDLHAKPFSISGSGTLESLNLAAAVNMCVYELNR